MATELSTMFYGYQLLGDSNFVRFCEQINRIRRVPKNKHNSRQLDLCVSGQGIRSLTRRVTMNGDSLQNNLLVLIGTNDLRNLTPIRTFVTCLHQFSKALKTRNIVMCTIPLPLLYEKDAKRIELWRGYNKAIMKSKYMRVIDLEPIFLDPAGQVNEKLYCRTYAGKRKRVDLIHFNKTGINAIKHFFLNHLPSIAATTTTITTPSTSTPTTTSTPTEEK